MERCSARGRSLQIRTKLKFGVLGVGALLIGRHRFARLVARVLPFASPLSLSTAPPPHDTLGP
jgi:hypothetical protein